MMSNLHDLYRNVTFLEEYDEQSFIGLWLDESIWSDEEYWKLDNALNNIKQMYPYPSDIPRDISACIAHITELMIVPNWEAFSVVGKNTSDEVSIFERFERLKFVLRSIFTGEELDVIHFDYRP